MRTSRVIGILCFWTAFLGFGAILRVAVYQGHAPAAAVAAAMAVVMLGVVVYGFTAPPDSHFWE
jgi:hypothetical protein